MGQCASPISDLRGAQLALRRYITPARARTEGAIKVIIVTTGVLVIVSHRSEWSRPNAICDLYRVGNFLALLAYICCRHIQGQTANTPWQTHLDQSCRPSNSSSSCPPDQYAQQRKLVDPQWRHQDSRDCTLLRWSGFCGLGTCTYR